MIFAGEIIFSLPFHIARFFRPTFLEVFSLSNTQLGDIFAVYGIIAMLAYFPGGLIADKFSARKLLSASLIFTAIGGLYLYTIPSMTGLLIVFGYFGLTSILLFWAAMIKATRDWGGDDSQGIAFGLLDGGRGFVASVAASIALFIFALFVAETESNSQLLKQGLQAIILFYSFTTFIASIFIWFLLVDSKPQNQTQETSSNSIYQVITNANVWLQGGIIVAAYCGYKALDNYGVYAVEVLKMSQLESAELTTLGSYLRPVAAIVAGLVADRFTTSRTILFLFCAASITFLVLSFINAPQEVLIFILTNLLITFAAVYALRGIYFALVEESRLNLNITGTAVGLISVIGFTPDIFFSPITGRILDANPGLIGFQHYFLLMASISIVGIVFVYLLNKKIQASSRKS